MKRYPKYKDSGAPWLGQVPAHWDVKRLKRVFSEVTERARPGDEQLAATQKYGVISQSQFMKAEDQKLVLALKGTENFKHVDRDDFVISLRAFEGGIERSNQPGCVSPAYTVLRPSRDLAPGYSARLLKTPAFISQISMTYDGIREGKAIKYKDAGPVFLPIPPLGEQARLSDFIDGAVAQMDSAISSQERMIELLKERRSTIITQAVTKGLDPKAKMKDSGVPWLGQVPAHWEVKALKHISATDSCGSYGLDEFQSEINMPVATTAQISKEGLFNVDDMPIRSFTHRELARFGCMTGDVLVVKSSGSASNIISGKAGLVEETTPKFVFSNFLLRLRVNKESACPYFIFSLLRSHLTRQRVELMCSTTTYPNLKIGEYVSAWLPVPPLVEQKAISLYLRHALGEIDSAVSSQERLIELLKERRSAIITQAVTGQIDVR